MEENNRKSDTASSELFDDTPTGELVYEQKASAEDATPKTEQSFSFLESADELAGIDFGAATESLKAAFSAKAPTSLEEDFKGDETTVLQAENNADEATTVLGDTDDEAFAAAEDNDLTRVAPVQNPNDTGAVTDVDSGEKPPRQPASHPIAAAAVAALIAIIVATLAINLPGKKAQDEPDTGVNKVAYNIVCVDQDGKELKDVKEFAGDESEAVTVSAPSVKGYKLTRTKGPKGSDVSKDKSEVSFALTQGMANQVTFRYTKKVTYKIKYLVKSSGKSIKKTTNKTALAGDKIKVKAPAIKGYDRLSGKQKTLILKTDPKKNVVTFYYKKHVKPAPATSYDDESSSYSDGGQSSYKDPYADYILVE